MSMEPCSAQRVHNAYKMTLHLPFFKKGKKNIAEKIGKEIDKMSGPNHAKHLFVILPFAKEGEDTHAYEKSVEQQSKREIKEIIMMIVQWLTGARVQADKP